MPAIGKSMFPYIQEGDICRFIDKKPNFLKTGEVALFYNRNGQLVAHRLHKTFIYHDEQSFLFKGDSNLGFDELVSESQIIGKLEYINGRIKPTENLFSKLYCHLVLNYPILSRLFRIYLDKIKIS
ncbi:S24/S26 family peptidase [Bacillus sp. AFS002410]|uniref:S24/S26 family peptidase n=1 Tax=Bacillus sp. AFS002410 TaxID=2033481 RepID=UPI001155C9F8|nr:S24/S26 family peptidase [Bacillus sp. AFS002410]